MFRSRLFASGRIGTVTVKNRIIYSSIMLRSTDGHGHFTEQAVASLLERAKHGAGIVTVPGLVSKPSPDSTYGLSGSIAEDSFIPHLGHITDGIHGHDCLAMAQLGARGTRMAAGVQSVAPSSMRFAYEKAIPHELTREEIQTYVREFEQGARRAKEAGFDLLELHACTGKLISMFLSPYSNRRTDEYGGSTRNRARFACELLQAMRRGAGPEIPIVVRMSVDDLLGELGLQIEEGKVLVSLLDEAGADAFHVLGGTQEKIWNISAGYFQEEGVFAPLLREVRKATKKPLIGMGKLGRPALAESFLEEGLADFIALGRPLLTDPRWPEKVQSGHEEDIVPCLGCVNCFTFASRKDLVPFGVSCTVNPTVLREKQFEVIPRAQTPKRIVVAGGGIAGMKAAAVLQSRGHSVTLCEQSGELGGQWIVASRAPYKKSYTTLIPMLHRDMVKAGVDIRLHTCCDESLLRQLHPDCVVMATGAVPSSLPSSIPVGKGPRIVQGNDVIMDRVSIDEDAVVVVGGRYVGMEVAVKLAQRGKNVSLIEMGDIAHGTNPRLGGKYISMLVESGVRLYPQTTLLQVTDTGIAAAFCDAFIEMKADVVVLAIGVRPNVALEETVRSLSVPCYRIGDCRRIGDALYAMRDAFDLGMTL